MIGVRRGLFALLVLVGCADGLALSVDVKTDFVPGPEFAAVRVTLVGEGTSSAVGAAGDYLRGQRAVDLAGLEENRARTVSVELLDAQGNVVAERSALVDHRVDLGLTLTLARDCAGVVCPGAGAAAATACFGGRCADPECIDGTEPSCPEQECRADTDCPVLNACSSRRCIDTLCLYAPQVGACGVGFYCSPEQGCLALPSPVDASVDSAVDDVSAALGTPTLTWPQNGAVTGTAPGFTLHWLPVAGATSYTVETRRGCPAAMGTPCTSGSNRSGAAAPRFDLVVTALSDSLPAGRRDRWRVRACRAEDDCGDWSPERYFDVGRGATDFDGDGVDELMVGSYGHVSVFEWAGGVFTPSQELPTPFSDGTSGFALDSFFGDVNGDGYMDAAIGAQFDRGFGSVAMYHGGPGGLTFDKQIQSPPSSRLNGFFSDSLCLADFDADGYADLAVGSASGTYVFRGSAAGVLPELVAELPERLRSCADVNEDGHADVIVSGAYYPGHASLVVETAALSAPASTNYFVGDVNADGLADFVGGGPGDALLVYGNSGGLDPAFTMAGVPGGVISFDYQALALADLSGDGVSDVVMGDAQSDAGWPGIVAYSLGGVAGLGPRQALDIPCVNACNRRGSAVSYGFDLNDDGFGDAAVSANDEEGVFVFFGGPTGLTSSVRVERSQSMYSRFGSSL